MRAADDNLWESQGLMEKADGNVASDVQARMIAFSIAHCKDNDIGGEWTG